MIIAIDFDGTCVTHAFPQVGEDIGAVPVLKRLVKAGHQLILFTMRGNRPIHGETGDPTIMDVTGMFLDDAINWFRDNEIPLYGIQTNPTQHIWTTSPKAYAQMYIDDAALGCPLKLGYSDHEEEMFIQYADWVKIEKLLEDSGVI